MYARMSFPMHLYMFAKIPGYTLLLLIFICARSQDLPWVLGLHINQLYASFLNYFNKNPDGK